MSEKNDWNQKVIEEFRANEGKVGGRFENATLLLLNTIAAKSGEKRINPMMTVKDGEGFIVVASNGGAPTHPAWYHNLVANPDVTVEVGTEVFDAVATVSEEPERSRLFAKMVAISPFFAEYEQKTDRVIPVILVNRK